MKEQSLIFSTHSSKKHLYLLLLAVFLMGLFLSIMRNAANDEVLYLVDALQISNCFQEGRWIGNETIGLHGFIFKIPAALLFLLTGPSVFAATLTNILLAIAAVYLSYLIFFYILRSPKYALAGSFLVFTGVFFLRALATFLRDSSIVFALLFFIYLNLKKKNKWFIGLSFLLVLDAKENVFFIILPGFLFYILYEEYLKNKKKVSFISIKSASFRIIAALLPSLIFISLMFTTSTIPLNPFIAKILGLHKQSTKMYQNQFKPQPKKNNKKPSNFKRSISDNLNNNSLKSSLDEKVHTFAIKFLGANKAAYSPSWLEKIMEKIKWFFHILLLYLSKLFHYRTFSFTSMPKFIIVPAFVMIFYSFRLWRKAEEYEKLILPLIIWSFLLIYWLRSGVGRNIIPASAIIILFFLLFIKKGIKNKILAKNTLIATTVFTAIGVFFLPNYPFIKLSLSILFISWLWVIFYFQQKENQKILLFKLKTGFIISLGVFSVFIFLATSFTKPNQLGRWVAWGIHSQMPVIANLFKIKETIWINYDKSQVQFFREDKAYPPFREELRLWDFNEWLSRKANMFNKPSHFYTYSFKWKNNKDLMKQIKKNSIEKIALLVSTHKNEKYTFPYQDRLQQLQDMAFLKLKREILLKNKILFIFKVVNT